jgi:hypothetical protein
MKSGRLNKVIKVAGVNDVANKSRKSKAKKSRTN